MLDCLGVFAAVLQILRLLVFSEKKALPTRAWGFKPTVNIYYSFISLHVFLPRILTFFFEFYLIFNFNVL